MLLSASSDASASMAAALGAVAIAAMGVYGVYQLSWWVADKSGRSMDAESSYAPPPMILSPDLLAGKKVRGHLLPPLPAVPSIAGASPGWCISCNKRCC